MRVGGGLSHHGEASLQITGDRRSLDLKVTTTGSVGGLEAQEKRHLILLALFRDGLGYFVNDERTREASVQNATLEPGWFGTRGLGKSIPSEQTTYKNFLYFPATALAEAFSFAFHASLR